MKNYDILSVDASLYRVLSIESDKILVIDCLNPQMPYYNKIKNNMQKVKTHIFKQKRKKVQKSF